jgi:hypothetical protein
MHPVDRIQVEINKCYQELNFLRSSDSIVDDIVFQDDDICILRPDSHRGIVIYHIFPQKHADAINAHGLLLHAGIKTGDRKIDHPYIFFRAPGVGMIPCGANATLDNINANYPDGRKVSNSNENNGYFCIRIDPDKTFVYSSECRVVFQGTDMWKNSRSSLRNYLDVIAQNKSIKSNKYNIFSYEKVPPAYSGDAITELPPERNAEILARCDIPNEWRVNPT